MNDAVARVDLPDHAPHVLVVDDDRRLRDLLARFLVEHGYRVTTAASAAEARAKSENFVFDVLVLDVMMPGENGFDYARTIRATSRVPIMMLTARADAEDRVTGLEIGADDYLPKPFEPRELLARLRAILRRGRDDRKSEVLRFGRLEIDRDAREVRLDGSARVLTSYQYELLLVLADHAGRVMSRDVLMDLLKAQPLEAFDRSIDVHISRIRAAIEDDARKPRRVITVRGAGYVFAKAQD